MTSILAIAAMGTWSYAGFLAEPGPEPIEERNALPPVVRRPAEPVAPPTAPTPPPATPAVAAAAAPPTRYRLADARGQTWEHADPVVLRDFVHGRNTAEALLLRSPAPCVSGRCR